MFIALQTLRERRGVKGIDLRAAVDAKRDMQCWNIGFAAGNPEVGFGRDAEACRDD